MEILKNSYQLYKIKKKNNYKRIATEIRKIDEIINVTIKSADDILHIEIDTDIEKNLETTLNKVKKAINKYEKAAELEEIKTKETYRRVLILRGLDCGHCAARIETLAKRAFSHEKLVVDFATERFIIETTDEDLANNITEEVATIAHKIDPNIAIMDIKTRKRKVAEDFRISRKDINVFFIGIFFLLLAFIPFHITDQFSGINIVHFMKEFLSGRDYELSLYSKIVLLVSFLVIGNKVIWKFVRNIMNGQIFDENFLMSVASIGAIFTGHNIEAVMVMMLYQIGSFLQERAVNHSRKSISELLSIEATFAHLKIGSDITDVEVESVLPGDTVVVRTGEMIPLDGVVTEGKTYLDTKALTGESVYRSVKANDEVLSGTINMGGVMEVKVTKPYGESIMSKIIDMVENASSSKAKAEDFISKFAKYYTPIVAALALVIAILVPFLSQLVGKTGVYYHDYIYRAMVFLVIACPCALVISIPLSFFAGIGIASKRGILIKGSNYLEALNNVENVIFDKTGTLTKGEFGIKEVVPINPNTTKEELQRLIAYSEYYSTHPIGMSIVEEYGRDEIFPEIIEEFFEFSGRGVRAIVNGSKIMVGNSRLMKENKFEVPNVQKYGLILHVTKDKVYLGYAVVGDVIRDEATDTIYNLRKKGIKKIYLLTGDSKGVGESVANILDIDEVYSELLPNEKVEKLNEIRATHSHPHSKTIYIGDGINDAPVISSADVGIAMGATGSDAAIAIADVVIMSDNLEKVEESVTIAQTTRKLVIQNIIMSLGIKFFVLFLGIFGSFTIWLAIFSDVGVSLLAILNAMRVMRLYKSKNKNKEDKEESNK